MDVEAFSLNLDFFSLEVVPFRQRYTLVISTSSTRLSKRLLQNIKLRYSVDSQMHSRAPSCLLNGLKKLMVRETQLYVFGSRSSQSKLIICTNIYNIKTSGCLYRLDGQAMLI